jgi:hypothetical protein
MPMKIVVVCCVNCVNTVEDFKVTLTEWRNLSQIFDDV